MREVRISGERRTGRRGDCHRLTSRRAARSQNPHNAIMRDDGDGPILAREADKEATTASREGHR